jgi:hypothetical protein
MIEAYLDESSDAQGRMVCVAGYAGHRDQWAAFEQEWSAVLAASGLKCFHAVEARCDTLRPALAEAIERRTVLGVMCTLSPDDYARGASRRFKSTLGGAYAICAFGCALKIAEWAGQQELGPVSFTLEHGQPKLDFVQRTLESLVGDDQFNVASVAVATKSACVALQPADFLAHCGGVYERAWLTRLIESENAKAQHAHLTDETLISVSTQIDELYRRQRYNRRRAAREARPRPTTS